MAEVSERLGSGPSHTPPWVDLVRPVLSHPERSEPPYQPRAGAGAPWALPPPISATVRMRGRGGGARGAGGRVPGRDPGPRGGRAPWTGWAGRRRWRPGRRRRDCSPACWGEHGAESAALCERKVSRVELVWLWELGRGPPRGRGAAGLLGSAPRSPAPRSAAPEPRDQPSPRRREPATAGLELSTVREWGRWGSNRPARGPQGRAPGAPWCLPGCSIRRALSGS